jgi:TolB protein
MRIGNLLLLALFAFSGCDIFGGGGGGGNTGGGTGSFNFTKGFTYVRRDDRNVYAVNDSATDEPAVLTAGLSAFSPSFSPDKKTIVFVTGTGESSAIATVPSTGGAVRTLLTASAQQRDLKTPVFSPDGAFIAFSYMNGSVSEVAVMNADGTGVTPLGVNGSLSYASPSWSIDGVNLYVGAGGALGLTQVEKIVVAANTVVNVTNSLGNEAQSISGRVVISPDGSKLVFDGVVSSGATRIFSLDVTSKAVTMIFPSENGANESFPTWVDNGTVAFSSDSGGNDSLYSVALPSSASPSLLVPKAIEGWYSR